MRKNRKAAQRWARTKVWIIDEGQSRVSSFNVRPGLQADLKLDLLVSMLDGDLFDKLSQVGQILRKKPEPFGGIQVRCLVLLP